MYFNRICWLLLTINIGYIYTQGHTKLCDVRVWYLNLITDDVFNIEMNHEQLQLKNSIEALVMKSAESEETRMTNCHVLYMYNDMLKETFKYSPSEFHSRMDIVEVEKEEPVAEINTSAQEKEISNEAKDEGVQDETANEIKNEETKDKEIMREQKQEDVEYKKTADEVNDDVVKDEETKNIISNEDVKEEKTKAEIKDKDQADESSTIPSNSSANGEVKKDTSIDKAKQGKDTTSNMQEASEQLTASKEKSENEAKDTVEGETTEYDDDETAILYDDSEIDETECDEGCEGEMKEDETVLDKEPTADDTSIPDIRASQLSKETTKEHIMETAEGSLVEDTASAEDLTIVEADGSVPRQTPYQFSLFGMCKKDACYNVDIFDMQSDTFNFRENLDKERQAQDHIHTATESRTANSSSVCVLGPVCSQKCYFVMSYSYCMIGYDIQNKSHMNKEEKQNETLTDKQPKELHKSIITVEVSATSETGDNLADEILGTGEIETSKIHEQRNDYQQVESVITEQSEAEQLEKPIDTVRIADTEHQRNSAFDIDTLEKELFGNNDKEQNNKKLSDFTDTDTSTSTKDDPFAFKRFENILHQTTAEYSNKIQSLEIMIMRLENKVLMEKLNKQNHSSTIIRLENLILKLENDLLRMNKNFEKLREETETLSRNQKNYIEIAHQQHEKMLKYPGLPDHSAKRLELVAEHQAKIQELTDVLRNQSAVIAMMKNRSDYLEDQNRVLHQMVMNQTVFMAQIIQRVQELADQNSKQKEATKELNNKLEAGLAANKLSELAKLKEAEIKAMDSLPNMETLISDTKINLAAKGETKQKTEESSKDINTNSEDDDDAEVEWKHYLDEKPTNNNVTRWCPAEIFTCPVCMFNTIMTSHQCVPYRSLIWTKCTQSCKIKPTISRENETSESGEPKLPQMTDSSEEKDTNEYTNKDESNVSDEGGQKGKEVIHSTQGNIDSKGSPQLPEDQINTIPKQTVAVIGEDGKENVQNKDVPSSHTSQPVVKQTDEHATEKEENLIPDKDGARPPSTAKDDATPSTTKDGAPPSTTKDGVPQSTAKDGAPPSTAKDGAPPSTAKDGAPPSTAKDGAPLSTAKDEAPPPTAKDGAPLSTAKDEAPPSTTKDGAPPSPKNDGAPPSTTKDGAPPPTAKDGAPPSTAKDGAPPFTAESKPNQDSPAKSTSESKDSAKPREEKDIPKEGSKGKDNSIKTTDKMERQQGGSDDKDKKDKGPTTRIKGKDDKKQKGIQKPKAQKRMTPLYADKLSSGGRSKEPKDCYDYYQRGNKRDGVYKVKLLGNNAQIQVYCDMKKGGWTLIQKRQDGTTNFFQDWDEYKKGFGGLYGEHWLGNDHIHQLTNQDYYTLKVDLIDWKKNTRYAQFEYFLVEPEKEGYRLHIDGYSGDAGDGLTKHNGNKFSTKDVDNDKVEKEFGGSCAKRFHGAGWYYKCYASNLNGKYYRSGKIPEKQYDGVTWKPWTGPNLSMKFVEMKIRPASATD